ncbi:MAG: trigger factor family protein, partial [Bacteroidaceae bacterium]|nr:trigger factor family protein [Bacteroidaceae bacterium]
MEFTFTNLDATSARLVVKVVEADYASQVEKTLKNFRQKANVPGFRPGMVPMGLIKKQYGTAVKAEEINKVLQQKVFEYIKENKIDMLGEPLPSAEQQSELDFVNGTEFTFEFDIALAPKFMRDALLELCVRPTCAAYIVYGMIQKAAKGDTSAAKFIKEINGEG